MGSPDRQPMIFGSAREARSSLAHHIVIVGAGFAGLALAQALGSTPLRVTVIDRHNYHLFQPLLYQVATAVLSPGEIAQPIRRILGRHKNITVLMGGVDHINQERKELSVDGEALSYDTLVLATGATHGYFSHPEWARFAPGLKTLEDARRIRAEILTAFERAEREHDPAEQERLMTFAIIGGGPTGVEMAGAIAGLARQALARDFRHIDPKKARILLIEAAPRILGPFPEDLSAYAARALERLGVTLRTGKSVEDINERGVTVGGEFIPCSTIVWAAGVAASPAGQWLHVGTDQAGRVAVAPNLSVPGLDNVYVLGDLALAMGEVASPCPAWPRSRTSRAAILGRRCWPAFSATRRLPPSASTAGATWRWSATTRRWCTGTASSSRASSPGSSGGSPTSICWSASITAFWSPCAGFGPISPSSAEGA
jgi:NADH dehydrogenase